MSAFGLQGANEEIQSRPGVLSLRTFAICFYKENCRQTSNQFRCRDSSRSSGPAKYSSYLPNHKVTAGFTDHDLVIHPKTLVFALDATAVLHLSPSAGRESAIQHHIKTQAPGGPNSALFLEGSSRNSWGIAEEKPDGSPDPLTSPQIVVFTFGKGSRGCGDGLRSGGPEASQLHPFTQRRCGGWSQSVLRSHGPCLAQCGSTDIESRRRKTGSSGSD